MNSQLPRKAIIALTSHSAPFYPDGRKNGVFYTEVAHPYQELTQAGFEVELASETGAFVIDAYSLEDQFLNEEDTVVLNSPDHPFSVLLNTGVRKASDLKASDYGLFFASAGFASVYDYPSAMALQAVAQDVWARGGVVAAVCHGGAIFPGVKDAQTGQSIIEGKEVTGFSTQGDEMAGVLARIHGDGVKTTEESAVSAHITAVAAIEAFDKA
jgi:D-lactate dehydratase